MRNRAWIIGNAPSIAKLDMTRLKDEITFSFNRAYIAYEDWGWYPNYYMVIDSNILRQITNDINDLIRSGEIGQYYFNRDGSENIIKADNVHIIDLAKGWGFNPDRFNYCGDVAACALQIAYTEGYHKLYLAGVDQSWGTHGETAPNADTDHFRPDYETDAVRMSKIYADGHFSSWKQSIIEAKEYDMQIITTTPSKLSGYVPFVPFSKVT